MSYPVRTAFIYLMHLAWKSRLHIPFLLTVCFLVFDIRLQLEVNINMTRRRAQRMGIEGDGNDRRNNHAPNGVNFNIDDDFYDDDDDDVDDNDNDSNEEETDDGDANGETISSETAPDAEKRQFDKKCISIAEIPKFMLTQFPKFVKNSETRVVESNFFKFCSIDNRNNYFNMEWNFQPFERESDLMIALESNSSNRIL